VNWPMTRWVGVWALVAILALGGLFALDKWRETVNSTKQETAMGSHCHVYLFSGGANLGQWEADSVVRHGSVFYFESDGFDYRITGDVVVECGHLDGVS